MFEMNLLGTPAGAQAGTEDVDEHAHGQFGVLAPPGDPAVEDAVLQPQEFAAADEAGLGGLLMQREQPCQIVDGGAQGRRGQGDLPDEAEVLRLELLAVPQAEIVVPRVGGGQLHHPAIGAEIDGQERIGQLLLAQPGVRGDPRRVAAVAGDEPGDPRGGRGQDISLPVFWAVRCAVWAGHGRKDLCWRCGRPTPQPSCQSSRNERPAPREGGGPPAPVGRTRDQSTMLRASARATSSR